MSARVQRWAVALFLLAFALWPLAQRWLVEHYRVDSWRLGGWAMYCTPPLQVATGFKVQLDGRTVTLSPGQLPGKLAGLVQEYNGVRRALGKLVPPHALGHMMLGAIPRAEVVEVVVRQQTFDTASATFREEEERHEYRRPAATR